MTMWLGIEELAEITFGAARVVMANEAHGWMHHDAAEPLRDLDADAFVLSVDNAMEE
jgi:hypothetical protein